MLVKVFHDIVNIATFLAGSEMLEGVRALPESLVVFKRLTFLVGSEPERRGC